MSLIDEIGDVDEMTVRKPDGLRGRFMQATMRLTGTLAGTIANYNAAFFTADRSYEVVGVEVRFETQGGPNADMSLYITPSGTFGAAGKSVLSAAIDLTQAPAYCWPGLLSGTPDDLILHSGDSLTADAQNVATVVGLCLTVYLKAI